MKTYRIKQYKNEFCTYYKIQRKTIFGFWYNPLNIDADTTGIFDDEKEAKNTLKEILSKTKTKIVYEVKSK